jgi:ubiquinone/menaquinone biosynthesis C-methylase UbiE
MRAYRNTNVLFAAFQLGVLENLSLKEMDLDNLAKDLKLSKKGLFKLLSALCALDIVVKKGNHYTLSTNYTNFFDPHSRHNIGGLIKHEIHLQKRWMKLSKSIKSGLPIKNINEPVNPEDTNRFINAMVTIGQRTAPLMIEKVQFNGNEHVLDLGGGPGKYLEKLCERYPHMQMTLFDQPQTISSARKSLSKHKYYKNMHFIEGDFLKDRLGKNYDVIFSSNVIHIFGPEELQALFNKCYRALKPSGRLLIKDYFLNNEYTGPLFSSLFSIHMFLSTENGKCYSHEEIKSLLEESQFSYKQTIDLTESSKVIEGIKKAKL